MNVFCWFCFPNIDLDKTGTEFKPLWPSHLLLYTRMNKYCKRCKCIIHVHECVSFLPCKLYTWPLAHAHKLHMGPLNQSENIQILWICNCDLQDLCTDALWTFLPRYINKQTKKQIPVWIWICVCVEHMVYSIWIGFQILLHRYNLWMCIYITYSHILYAFINLKSARYRNGTWLTWWQWTYSELCAFRHVSLHIREEILDENYTHSCQRHGKTDGLIYNPHWSWLSVPQDRSSERGKERMRETLVIMVH